MKHAITSALIVIISLGITSCHSKSSKRMRTIQVVKMTNGTYKCIDSSIEVQYLDTLVKPGEMVNDGNYYYRVIP